jgi:DNA ligase D-like protein (predicted 3'-phosphoesterase)
VKHIVPILVVFVNAFPKASHFFDMFKNNKKHMSLQEYNKKRDFEATREPEGKVTAKIGNRLIFVIQKHNAKSLHYDLRLEADGVLKSWAVPKGPSLDPQEKRLAMMVEDHPLSYAEFEGLIPEGEYGAGSVIIWDKGDYKDVQEENGQTVPMSEAIRRGRIEVELQGEKLRGRFALIKAQLPGREENSWLLVKMRDKFADPAQNPVATQPASVVSGRTNQELEEEGR